MRPPAAFLVTSLVLALGWMADRPLLARPTTAQPPSKSPSSTAVTTSDPRAGKTCAQGGYCIGERGPYGGIIFSEVGNKAYQPPGSPGLPYAMEVAPNGWNGTGGTGAVADQPAWTSCAACGGVEKRTSDPWLKPRDVDSVIWTFNQRTQKREPDIWIKGSCKEMRILYDYLGRNAIGGFSDWGYACDGSPTAYNVCGLGWYPCIMSEGKVWFNNGRRDVANEWVRNVYARPIHRIPYTTLARPKNGDRN